MIKIFRDKAAKKNWIKWMNQIILMLAILNQLSRRNFKGVLLV
jgi:hypothetical protein